MHVYFRSFIYSARAYDYYKGIRGITMVQDDEIISGIYDLNTWVYDQVTEFNGYLQTVFIGVSERQLIFIEFIIVLVISCLALYFVLLWIRSKKQ
jgi:hypothetical protein